MLAIGAKLYMLNLQASVYFEPNVPIWNGQEIDPRLLLSQSGGIAPHEKASLLHAGLTRPDNPYVCGEWLCDSVYFESSSFVGMSSGDAVTRNCAQLLDCESGFKV